MLEFDRPQCARVLVALVLGLFLFVLTGCASSPPKVVEDGLAVRVEVGDQLNPNASGQSAPVFLRIYQLADKTAFARATYDELATNDKAALGADLLARRDVEVCPVQADTVAAGGAVAGCSGQARIKLQLDRITKAEYVAVVAEFYHLHDPQGNWRAVTATPKAGQSDSSVLVIKLQRSSVSVGFE